MVSRLLIALKKNDPIADEEHIARYIPWNKLRKDMDDNVIGILGEAFKLRPKENGLSSTRLEHFSGTFTQQAHSAVKEVRKYYNVKQKSHFAVGQAGLIKDFFKEQKQIKVHIISFPTQARLHDGTPYKNNSHVLVNKLPNDDMELLDLLASDVWNNLVPNSSVP